MEASEFHKDVACKRKMLMGRDRNKIFDLVLSFCKNGKNNVRVTLSERRYLSCSMQLLN